MVNKRARSKKVPCTKIELFVPAKERLAEILRDGLRQHFAEVSVEWVDCPDLTQEPFNLTAPGLCGNETLLDMGGVSNLFPVPQKDKIYKFNKILKRIDRRERNTLVIGAGLCPRPTNGELSELFMNAFFNQTIQDYPIVTNRSYLAYLFEAGFTALESYSELNPVCIMHGNFFVSDGKPGPVLKIQAKKRVGKKDFIEVMQESLYERYNFAGYTSAIVGLGGAFVVNNTKVILHLTPNDWPYSLTDSRSVHAWLNYRETNAPMVAVGTLTNASFLVDPITVTNVPETICLTKSHFHARSLSEGGHFYADIKPDKVEYLGYFHPAKMLYRFDQMPTWDPMPDFDTLKSYYQEL